MRQSRYRLILELEESDYRLLEQYCANNGLSISNGIRLAIRALCGQSNGNGTMAKPITKPLITPVLETINHQGEARQAIDSTLPKGYIAKPKAALNKDIAYNREDIDF